MIVGNGAAAHEARLKRLASATLTRNVGAALLATGKVIEEDTRETLNDGAISGPGHIPSTAPNPPNSDSHDLERSIHVTELVEVAEYLQTTVSEGGPTAPYAAVQELGGGAVAERPHLRPATERARQGHANRLKEAVAKTALGK